MIQITWFTESTNTQPDGGDSFEFTTGFLQLDILETENYTSQNAITSHAVEDGISINDHIIKQNDKITFKAVISNRQSSTRFVEGATHGTLEIDNGSELMGIIVPEDTDRISDVFEELLRLKRSGIRISVDGLQKPINDWLIESISAPRSVSTAGTLVVDISIMEMRTAVLEEIDAPSPRVERGRSSSNSGNAEEEETEETTREKAKSLLRSGEDYFRGRR